MHHVKDTRRSMSPSIRCAYQLQEGKQICQNNRDWSRGMLLGRRTKGGLFLLKPGAHMLKISPEIHSGSAHISWKQDKSSPYCRHRQQKIAQRHRDSTASWLALTDSSPFIVNVGTPTTAIAPSPLRHWNPNMEPLGRSLCFSAGVRTGTNVRRHRS